MGGVQAELCAACVVVIVAAVAVVVEAQMRPLAAGMKAVKR